MHTADTTNSHHHHRISEREVVGEVDDVVSVWELDVEGDGEVALVVILLVRVVVAVAVVADVRAGAHPTYKYFFMICTKV